MLPEVVAEPRGNAGGKKTGAVLTAHPAIIAGTTGFSGFFQLGLRSTGSQILGRKNDGRDIHAYEFLFFEPEHSLHTFIPNRGPAVIVHPKDREILHLLDERAVPVL